MSVDSLLHNYTSASARAFLIDHHSGAEAILVVAKRTYHLGDGGIDPVPQEDAEPIRLHDELHAGDESSVRYPSDLVDDKPGTDVVVVATAHPPAKKATSMRVSIAIDTDGGVRSRSLTVFGRRVWYRGPLGVVPGPPAPLGPTPLIYENAFGGTGGDGPVDWRNPCGRGAAADKSTLIDQPAHVIEDPADATLPAGFGAIAAQWSPRRERAGTHDERWRRERAPLRPLDFEPRHNNCAATGLWFERPLVGYEQIRIEGVHSQGPLQFRLPKFEPVFRCDTVDRTLRLDTHLDTVVVDTDKRHVQLTWRATMRAPIKLQRVKRLRIIARRTASPASSVSTSLSREDSRRRP